MKKGFRGNRESWEHENERSWKGIAENIFIVAQTENIGAYLYKQLLIENKKKKYIMPEDVENDTTKQL